MLLIVCMRIYGDRVVSSDLRGEDVNFILGRYNYYTCVLIKHSYGGPGLPFDFLHIFSNCLCVFFNKASIFYLFFSTKKF